MGVHAVTGDLTMRLQAITIAAATLVTERVSGHGVSGHSQKACLFAVWAFMLDAGPSAPLTLHRIGELAGCGHAVAFRSIKALEQTGVIVNTTPRGRRHWDGGSVYRIEWARLVELVPEETFARARRRKAA
jgi:hypothetical protein